MTGSAIAPLTPLLGRWRTEGSVLAEDGEAVASSFTGTDAYETLGDTFVLHRVDVVMADGPVHALEVIGPWDPFGEEFATHVFDAEGSVECSTVSVLPDGGFEFRSGEGPSRARATIHVDPGGQRAVGVWTRTEDDGATWRPWMRLQLTRLSDAVPTGT